MMLNFLTITLLVFLPFNKTSKLEETWVQEVNALRKTERTQPLVLDKKMSAKCRKYAKKLARTGKFEHDSRLRNEYGENIALGSDPDANPIEIWKNSTGHRRNMLDRDYKYVGVAMASNGNETYYVMRLK